MGRFTAITAQRLKELRAKRGIPSLDKLRIALENEAGLVISRDSLRGYEVQEPKGGPSHSSNDGMNAETLRTLAQFYGVSSDYILGLTEISTPNPTAQAACEYTGLTEENAKMLHEFVASDSENWKYGKTNPENARFPGLDLVNDFLDCVRNEHFMETEYWFLRYASHVHSTSGEEYRRVEKYRECADKLQEYGILPLIASDTVEFNSRRLANSFERFLNQKYAPLIGGNRNGND